MRNQKLQLLRTPPSTLRTLPKMALSFVHTADWHLGHTYWRIGRNATQSTQWRFEAVRRIWQLAADKSADFIVVAGDVFDTDTPSESVRHQTLELLADAPAPVYLISGNHDPAAEGSVWFHPDFAQGLAKLPRVHATLEAKPLEAEGDCLLFPCPVTRKYARADATTWIPVGERGQRFRVGLAHGSWRGYFGGEERELNCIASDCAHRAGLDYLALGDYHGFTPADHAAARARCFYAGTPEITARDSMRAGHALLVSLDEPGEIPLVEPHRVGKVVLHDLGTKRIAGGDDLEALGEALKEVENRDETILRVRIEGQVAPSVQKAAVAWATQMRDSWLGADIDVGKLRALPSRDDFAPLKLEPLEEALLEMLGSPLDLAELSTKDAARLSDWSLDERARQEAMALYFRVLGG